MTVGDRVYERIKLESRQVGVLRFNEHYIRYVVPREVNLEGIGIVQIREGNTIFGAHRLADDYFFDVVELVPVLVVVVGFFDDWLKLGTARNGYVERLGCEEGLEVKQVE